MGGNTMFIYKSKCILGIVPKSIESKVESTINEMLSEGWTFISMAGDPMNGLVLLFTREQ